LLAHATSMEPVQRSRLRLREHVPVVGGAGSAEPMAGSKQDLLAGQLVQQYAIG